MDYSFGERRKKNVAGLSGNKKGRMYKKASPGPWEGEQTRQTIMPQKDDFCLYK